MVCIFYVLYNLMKGLVMYTKSTVVTGKYDNPTRRLLIAIERGRGLTIAKIYVRLLVNVLVVIQSVIGFVLLVRGKGQL